MKYVEGGSEFLLSMLWTSNLSSSSDLEPHLNIKTFNFDVTHQLSLALSDSNLTFSSIIIQFLRESGVPCPHLFMEANNYFIADLVDLGLIDCPFFRPKILAWAVTGSTSVNANLDGEEISVCDIQPFVTQY